ncbi:MAG: hypothetical protein P0S95_02840 [Rhabdochlamydiaceae bacterium]|nr:hypothetical protein [Candidatus Amphrikana amoebophyrae]
MAVSSSQITDFQWFNTVRNEVSFSFINGELFFNDSSLLRHFQFFGFTPDGSSNSYTLPDSLSPRLHTTEDQIKINTFVKEFIANYNGRDTSTHRLSPI